MTLISPTKNNLLVAWSTIIVLLLVNIALVLIVPFKAAEVAKADLPNSPIDAQIRLEFSEPMDKKSVQDNFSIAPQVEGKFSWTGKTLVFTPNKNLEYKTAYSVKLNQPAASLRGKTLQQNFEQHFNTDEAGFFYISTAKNTYGQLHQFAVGDTQATPLTPSNLMVKSFDYDPSSKQIVLLTDKGISIFTLENKELITLNNLNSDQHQINRVKWLPYENALLISRTKVFKEGDLIVPSMEASDTELFSYQMESKKIKQIKTGFTLQYEFFATPDGSQIMLIDDAGNLVLKSLQDSKEELITSEFLEQYGFSEYGGYLLYTVTPPDDFPGLRSNLVIQNQDGQKNLLFGESFGNIDDPALAPDENFVAYKYSEEDEFIDFKRHYRLAFSQLKEQIHEVVTNKEDPSIDNPKFSPDGKNLSFIKLTFDSFDTEQETGWNQNLQKLIGGQISLYNLETKQYTFPPLEGCELEWIL